MYEMAWDVLNDAALELGLIQATIDDPYESTDQNIVQLRTLLKSVGRGLARDYHWTQLEKTKTFNTANGIPTYTLPADFVAIIDQTGWNRTTKLELGGPLSPQQWQEAQARGTSGDFRLQFRTTSNLVYLYPTPTTVQAIAYEYRSNYWMFAYDSDQGSYGSVPDIDGPSGDWHEKIAFDPLLIVRGLKLAFLRQKGFDSTAAEQDYQETLDACLGADGAAPVLSLNGRGCGPRPVDGCNLPFTGWGT